jgi:hypothetical protein
MNDEATPVSESRSSVEISTTAAGKPLVKVKVYAASTEISAVDEAAMKAVQTYKDVQANVA